MDSNSSKRESTDTTSPKSEQAPERKRAKLVTIAEPAAANPVFAEAGANPAFAEAAPPNPVFAGTAADPALPCNANECVELRLVRAPGFFSTFHPKFTHQLFGDDEQIEGYINPKVVVSYTSDFQSCMLDMSWSSKDAKAEDLREKLEPILPEKLASASDFSASLRKPLCQPPGEKLCEYVCNADGAESTFEVYRCDLRDPKMQAIYTNVETLPLLFIDGGSTIDCDDHRWQIFCCYERYQSNGLPAYALVSYVTVFKFNTLFRQGVCAGADSAVIRICQMLVLPPFQTAGHGAKLLKEVYRYAHNTEAIAEITVHT
jgi:histone acetyltransferase 1